MSQGVDLVKAVDGLVLLDGATTSVDYRMGEHFKEGRIPRLLSFDYSTATPLITPSLICRFGEIHPNDGSFHQWGQFQTVTTAQAALKDIVGGLEMDDDLGAIAGIGNHIRAPIFESSILRVALNAPAGGDGITVLQLRMEWQD